MWNVKNGEENEIKLIKGRDRHRMRNRKTERERERK